jgi:hypothetical protein
MTNLTLGRQVINFGETATVVGFHEKTGDPILFAPGGGKWMAKASKCEPTKDTFVYNTVPVQVGLDVSLWNNLIVSVGATYMWKEKPMVTLGIGVTF